MKVTVTSLLGNQPKEVKNTFEVYTAQDVDTLVKACITDRTATIKRQDGKETQIVYNGTVHTEVYNQKQLLVDWCSQRIDEFPLGGVYATASI